MPSFQTDPEEIYITGFFENGRRHGEGQMNYPNGDVYSGWWKYGQKEGKGAYVYAATGMRVIFNRRVKLLMIILIFKARRKLEGWQNDRWKMDFAKRCRL